MNVTITSGNCEVINSGVVTSYDRSPIEIGLPNPDGTKYVIKFEFDKDKDVKGHKLGAVSLEQGIAFKLTNFENPLGTGTIKPIDFATDGSGRKLFINFYVYTVGEANPTLFYTIYREN